MSARVAIGGEDRRFRRAGPKSGRRSGRRRSIPWAALGRGLLLLALTACVVVGARRALSSPVFLVQRIVLHGNSRLAAREVLALVNGLEGQPILTVKLDTWRARLLRSPWVADARLRRSLPGTIEISLVERRPLATARAGAQLYLVDQAGTVIDKYGPQYADIDLPIIDGLMEPGADRVVSSHAGLAAQVLDSLVGRGNLLQKVSQIDVTDPRNAVVILKQDGTRLHLGDAAFADRVQSYLDLAPALLTRVPEIDYVDLRFEPRIFVRPATAATGKTTGASLP